MKFRMFSSRVAKHKFSLACLTILTILTIHAADVSAMNVSAGDVAPGFSAKRISGETVALSDFRGEIVFVAFWSTWCSRCKEEMEYLKKLKVEYPEVVFLAVNAESEHPNTETILRMEKAIEEWELHFIVLIDEGLKIWDSYAVNALPSSIIVGRDGRIIFAEPNFYFGSAENIEKAMKGIDAVSWK